jgi:hypothetical protein
LRRRVFDRGLGVGRELVAVGAAQQRWVDHGPLRRVEDDQPMFSGQIANARNGSLGGGPDDDV